MFMDLCKASIHNLGSIQKNAQVIKNQPAIPLLQRLHLERSSAFEELNNDIEAEVRKCLDAKMKLQSIEYSNQMLEKELKDLMHKYETMLEKNKHDTRIILRLKNSESVLNQAQKVKEKDEKALKEASVRNREISLEHSNLQDERKKLLFKLQLKNLALGKINEKHQKIQDEIQKINERSRSDLQTHQRELESLILSLNEDEDIFEQWQKINENYDESVQKLQDELENAYKVSDKEMPQDQKQEEPVNASIEKLDSKEGIPKEDISSDESSDKSSSKDDALEHALLKKKVLYEIAEKQKDYLMKIYMEINKRLQDLSVEQVCVRQWRIDKIAQKKEIFEKAAQLEKNVAQKRRRKPIPQRSPEEEYNIWIKIHREMNSFLRNIMSKNLSFKLKDFHSYTEIENTIKTMRQNSSKQEKLPDNVLKSSKRNAGNNI